MSVLQNSPQNDRVDAFLRELGLILAEIVGKKSDDDLTLPTPVVSHSQPTSIRNEE